MDIRGDNAFYILYTCYYCSDNGQIDGAIGYRMQMDYICTWEQSNNKKEAKQTTSETKVMSARRKDTLSVYYDAEGIS